MKSYSASLFVSNIYSATLFNSFTVLSCECIGIASIFCRPTSIHLSHFLTTKIASQKVWYGLFLYICFSWEQYFSSCNLKPKKKISKSVANLFILKHYYFKSLYEYKYLHCVYINHESCFIYRK